jgi:hypothetical protein
VSGCTLYLAACSAACMSHSPVSSVLLKPCIRYALFVHGACTACTAVLCLIDAAAPHSQQQDLSCVQCCSSYNVSHPAPAPASAPLLLPTHPHPTPTPNTPTHPPTPPTQPPTTRSDPELQALIAARKAAWYAARPRLAGSGAYEAALTRDLGVPLDYDELMRSMVYAPGDVPPRWVWGEGGCLVGG